jgi:LysR family transcriptional regulator for bpeEF and oprC
MVARKLAGTRYLCCAAPSFLQQHGWPQTPEALDQFACLGFLNPRTRMVRPWRFSRDGMESSHIPQGLLAMDHVESMVAARAGRMRHHPADVGDPRSGPAGGQSAAGSA